MLVGFSHHHDNPGTTGQARAADYRALTDYMDSPWVMKVIGGARVRIDRAPVPEILYGRADVLRRQIAALPFQRKYRFGLLSFEERDIDVVAFNAGEARDVPGGLGRGTSQPEPEILRRSPPQGRRTAQGHHHRRCQKAGHHRQRTLQEPAEMGSPGSMKDTVASHDASDDLGA